MRLEALHIGLQVRHPQYGLGVVKSIGETTAEVQFNDGRRTVAPEPSGLEVAEPRATLAGLEVPLTQLIRQTVTEAVAAMGVEKPDSVVDQLAARWHGGKMVLHPADATLATKEVPLEILFHKIVGIRNQLRVLEQKVNAHLTMTDAEKVELQQYVTRCYGSLTTFNVLFKSKEDQFSSKAEA
jgi:hypothetical protein